MSPGGWNQVESQIADALRRLTSDGGDNNFVIVSCGDFYVQFAGARGSRQLYCEAVSNEYLAQDQALVPEKIDRLEQLGFDLDAGSNQYSRQFKIPGESEIRELAVTTLRILADVYGCRRDSEVHLELTLE